MYLNMYPHKSSRMPKFLFHLHLYFSNSCVCVSNITQLLCLFSFSICIFISLVPAYVYLTRYMHFPPLLYSYTFIAMFIFIYISTILSWPLIICLLHLQNVSVYPLLAVSPDVYTLVTPCSRVCISLIMRAYAYYECTYTIFTWKSEIVCVPAPSHMCVAHVYAFAMLIYQMNITYIH